MDFELSPEEQSFKEQVYDFLRNEVTTELVDEVERGEGWGPHIRRFFRKLGEKRWLAISWPEEYGGQGKSYMYNFILREAITRLGGPFVPPDVPIGLTIAGPTILLYGSDEQKKEYLPRIARGEIEFALGYTEPEAGSDLSNIQLRAVEQGDYFILNGQKMFNSGSHYADYHWLAVRTDPGAPKKHRGISLLIVDLRSPGITIRPLWAMGGMRTNEVFYSDVKVPKRNLVGEENRGFYYMSTALAFERVYDTGDIERVFDQLIAYACKTSVDDRMKEKLADIATQIEVARLFCHQMACTLNKGIVPEYEGSVCKVFISELRERLAQVGMEMLGPYAEILKGSKYAVFDGLLPWFCCQSRIRCITGGSTEIQRNVIALRGLGLPR